MERSGELRFCSASGGASAQGFRAILIGPANRAGESLGPTPAIGTAYIESQVFQTGDFIRAIVNGADENSGFVHGWRIQPSDGSHRESGEAWTPIAPTTLKTRRGRYAG